MKKNIILNKITIRYEENGVELELFVSDDAENQDWIKIEQDGREICVPKFVIVDLMESLDKYRVF